jgi:hypothetical protein
VPVKLFLDFFLQLWEGKCFLFQTGFELPDTHFSVCGYKHYGILVAIMVKPQILIPHGTIHLFYFTFFIQSCVSAAFGYFRWYAHSIDSKGHKL